MLKNYFEKILAMSILICLLSLPRPLAMNKIILIFLIFMSMITNAQDKQHWYAFWDSDSTYIGFKDENGKIRIQPKLAGFTSAKKFDEIMAVYEDDKGIFHEYYLTKGGKKVGFDSLYFFDNAPDCESEGFIRFIDKKTEMVGMFDKNGEIAIPSDYNALSRVENGLIAALKGATKVYWDKHKESGCNHFSWEGGEQYLIDNIGHILVKNFDYSNYINFFSLKIASMPLNDSVRKEFKGIDGQYYSFIDFEKEFKSQLGEFFKLDFTENDLLRMCYDSIYYWKDDQAWVSESHEKFLNKNFKLLKDRLLQLKINNTDFNIFIEGLNPYIFESDSFSEYFNNCGEAKESKYPVMNVVINTKNINGDLLEDHIDFLKTDYGYKLISVTIRNGKLE
jgi:hypothetical protein